MNVHEHDQVPRGKPSNFTSRTIEHEPLRDIDVASYVLAYCLMYVAPYVAMGQRIRLKYSASGSHGHTEPHTYNRMHVQLWTSMLLKGSCSIVMFVNYLAYLLRLDHTCIDTVVVQN